MRTGAEGKTKRSERETVVTLRLPRDLHQQLKKHADDGGRGFAAEVRWRLEAGISQPAEGGSENAKIRAAMNAIMAISRHSVEEHASKLGLDQFAVFKRAVEMTLRVLDPSQPPAEKFDRRMLENVAFAAATLAISASIQPDQDQLIRRLAALNESEDMFEKELQWERDNTAQ